MAWIKGIPTAAVVISLALAPLSCMDRQSAPELHYAWKRNFSNVRVKDLAMSWNGSLMVVSVNETHSNAKSKGDVAIGIKHSSQALRDWFAGGSIRQLFLNGEGKKLFVELDAGKTQYYDDWQADKRPKTISERASKAVLSPEGNYIALRAASGEIQVVTPGKKLLWTFPVKTADAWKVFFPFLNKPRGLLGVSPDGKIVYAEEEKILWQKDIGAPVIAAASSRAAGIVAVIVSSPKSELHFFNDRGETAGKSPVSPDAASLSCSDFGTGCAVLANGKSGQQVAYYLPSGKKVWSHEEREQASTVLPMTVTDHGKVVLAILDEAGKHVLHAWDREGKPLWKATIAGKAGKLEASWNGRRIAVLSNDESKGYVTFFDLDMTKPEKKKAQ